MSQIFVCYQEIKLSSKAQTFGVICIVLNVVFGPNVQLRTPATLRFWENQVLDMVSELGLRRGLRFES